MIVTVINPKRNILTYMRGCRFELGLVFAVIGTQISVITRLLLPLPFDLTSVLFLLSILLVVNYRQFITLSVGRPSRYLTAVLFYNLYVIIAAIKANAPLTEPNTGIIYSLYVVVFLCALCFNSHRTIDKTGFVNLLWGISGVYCVLLLYLITNHFRRFTGNNFVWISNGSFSADRLTLSVVAFIHMISFLVYKARGREMVFLRYLMFFIAGYDMVVCSRRGLLLTFIIVVLYRMLISRKGIRINKKFFMSLVMGFVAIVMVFVVAWFVMPAVRSQLQKYAERIIQGVTTYFGRSNGQDAAAANRASNFTTVPMEYLQSGLKIIVFGNGYAYRHLDIPYLQAFTDLGLIGGIWYLLIAGIIPVMKLAKRTSDDSEMLIRYIAIMNIAYNLYSGVPYNHYKFVGLILLGYVEMVNKREKLRGSRETEEIISCEGLGE